jgi:hypothetical protein
MNGKPIVPLQGEVQTALENHNDTESHSKVKLQRHWPVVVNFTFLRRVRTYPIENLLPLGDERSGRPSLVRLLALTLGPLLVDIPG